METKSESGVSAKRLDFGSQIRFRGVNLGVDLVVDACDIGANVSQKFENEAFRLPAQPNLRPRGRSQNALFNRRRRVGWPSAWAPNQILLRASVPRYTCIAPMGVPMLALRLPPEIEARLAELAKRTGRSKSFYAREAILKHIDELEDIYLAESRLEALLDGRSGSIPLTDLLRRHGVED